MTCQGFPEDAKEKSEIWFNFSENGGGGLPNMKVANFIITG